MGLAISQGKDEINLGLSFKAGAQTSIESLLEAREP